MGIIKQTKKMNSRLLTALSCLILASILPSYHSMPKYSACSTVPNRNWMKPTSIELQNAKSGQDATIKMSFKASHDLNIYWIFISEHIGAQQTNSVEQFLPKKTTKSGETFSFS